MADSKPLAEVLKIPKDVLDNIDAVNEKIKAIEQGSAAMSKAFTQAMTNMSAGAGNLLERLKSIETSIGKLGNLNMAGLNNVSRGFGDTATQGERAANSIAQVAAAMNQFNSSTSVNTSVRSWQFLQEVIIGVEQRQKELNKLVEEYQRIAKTLNVTVDALPNSDLNAYKNAQLELEANRQLIASYREKQQAIISYQQQQKKELENAQALKSYVSGQSSLPNQRAAEELRQMNEYYKELEKSSAKAAAQEEQRYNRYIAQKQKEVEAEQKAEQEKAAIREKWNKQYSGTTSSNVSSATKDTLELKQSISEWTSLQKNVEQLEQRQKELNTLVKEYEATLNRISSGKGGTLSVADQQSYKAAQQELEANKQLIASYREKQQAIIAYQQQQRQELQNAQALRNYANDQSSLPNQRSAAALQQLSEYYRELERTSAQEAKAEEQAAQRRQKAVEQAAAAAEKAREREAKAAEASAKRQEAAQARLDSRLRRSNYNDYITSTEGSLRTADKADTYNKRAQAIKNLEAAMKRLRSTDASYEQDLNRLTTAHNRLVSAQQEFEKNLGRIRQSQSSLMNTSQQLARQLALLFSVSAIESYVRKLIDVRGEFELQNTALAAILDNKDQADRLFAQITELAVRSPFTIRELTTYTKSLAAYQVQYEDLYDTTKRLADISSGLGVDMQRLILAFGQVKAANYLRGTELRQFTEAGVNMLKELAQYYSELENRIVSVGDVQERVSNRMVSFADVETVIKRLTDEGGMFYEMQEKQADTLRGMMMNLEDQIDLMLNDIGSSNQGAIVTVINGIKTILENWKEIANVIEPIGVALATYATLTTGWGKVVGTVSALWKTVRVNIELVIHSIRTAKTAQDLFNTAAKKNAWILVGSIIVGAVVAVRDAIKSANEEQERYNEITNEGLLKASELSARFKSLADAAVNAADGSKEQQKALEELNKSYSDILPKDVLKIERLREMKGAYDEVTTAIYNKIEADVKENLLAEVDKTYGSKAVESFDKLAKKLTEFNISMDAAREATRLFRAGIESGEITKDNYIVKLQDIIQGLTGSLIQLDKAGKAISVRDGVTTTVGVPLEEATDAIMDFEKWMEERANKTSMFSNASRGYGGYTEVYDELTKQMNAILDERKEWEGSNEGTFEMSIELSEESKKRTIQQLQNLMKQIQEGIDNGTYGDVNRTSAELVIQHIQEAIDKLNVSPLIKKVNDIRLSVSRLTGVDLGKINATAFIETSSFEENIARLDNAIASYKNILDIYEEAAKQGREVPEPQADSLLQGMTLDEVQKTYDALVMYEKELTIIRDKNKRSSSKDPLVAELQEMIKLIKNAYEAYKKLNAIMDKETARREVLAMPEFQNSSAWDIISGMDFDTQGLIDAYNQAFEKIYNNASTKSQEELKKIRDNATQPLQTELQIIPREESLKTLKNYIDDLFSQYDNSKKFQDLGLSKDIVKELFPYDEIIDLDDLKEKLALCSTYLEKSGTEGQKILADANKNLAKIEQEQIEQEYKTYLEYLTKSVSERTRIEVEAQQKIAKVRQNQNLSSDTKDYLVQSIQIEADEKINSSLWKDFQDSSTYTQLFQNLESTSTSTIKNIMDKLEELKKSMNNLSPEQLKVINEYYDQLSTSLAKKNPFKAVITSLQEIKVLQKNGRTEQSIQESLVSNQALANSYSQQISDMQTIIMMRERGLSLDSLGAEFTEKNNNLLSQTTDQLKAQIREKQKSLKSTQSDIGVDQKDLETYQRARENANLLGTTLQKVGTLAETSFEAVNSVLDSLGEGLGDNTDVTKALISALVQMGLQILQIAVMAEVMDKSFSAAMGTISWISIAISGVASIFTSLFAIHDNKLQKQIENIQDAVDALEDSYENLERTIENTTRLEAYTRNSELVNNLLEQIQYKQQQIALEQDKKKVDDDQIAEWREDIEDAAEEISDLYDDLREELIGDVSSMADNMASAIVDAFREGEDAVSAFNESVDDMIADIITNLVSIKVIEPLLDDAVDELYQSMLPETYAADQAAAELEELTQKMNSTTDENLKTYYQNLIDKQVQTVAELSEAAEGEMPNLTDDIINTFQSAVYSIYDAIDESGIMDFLNNLTSGELSGLTGSIEGMSEDTADALASLLNSIRLYVSDQNTLMQNIYNAIESPASDNPFLVELKNQTTYLDNINTMLSAVVKNVSGQGKALKVQIV